MPETVMPPTKGEYRTTNSPSLAVVRGSQSRSVVLRERRALMRREGHNLAIVATKDGYAMDPMFDWLGDLRRGQRQIWGSLLRFIDTLARREVPKRIADMLAPFVQAYVDDAYEHGTPNPPTEQRRAA